MAILAPAFGWSEDHILRGIDWDRIPVYLAEAQRLEARKTLDLIHAQRGSTEDVRRWAGDLYKLAHPDREHPTQLDNWSKLASAMGSPQSAATLKRRSKYQKMQHLIEATDGD